MCPSGPLQGDRLPVPLNFWSYGPGRPPEASPFVKVGWKQVLRLRKNRIRLGFIFYRILRTINKNAYLIIELGISAKRRKDEVNRLNEVYVDMIPEKPTIQKCLKYLCQTEPYRMLRDWSYQMKAGPLPSETAADPPDYTDVSFTYTLNVFFIY